MRIEAVSKNRFVGRFCETPIDLAREASDTDALQMAQRDLKDRFYLFPSPRHPIISILR
jgi:hypothetical protein